jgi:RND family efflux transporter MFP subunit
MGEPGQVVSAGQTVITLGQQAKVTLWAGPRVSLEGRIREIAGQADPASRTYAVRIAVSGSPQIMRLGMTASVALRMHDEAPGVVVPLTALTESEGSPEVFVVDPTNAAVREAPVSVDGIAEDGVRITDGLRVGEVVVTAGVQFLRDGMRVRLPDERQHARSRSSS